MLISTRCPLSSGINARLDWACAPQSIKTVGRPCCATCRMMASVKASQPRLAWLAAWPVWQQPAPPAWTVVPALAGIVWLLLPRGFPARWLGCVLLLPVLLWQAPRPPAGEAWVDVLDVGQGLAVVVRTATHDLLYDTGPRYSAEADAGQRVVAPFLRAVGIRRLDTLIASHQDTDHTGGLASVRMALPVSRRTGTGMVR